jgi:capsular polysaccharide biosynthesis protein
MKPVIHHHFMYNFQNSFVMLVIIMSIVVYDSKLLWYLFLKKELIQDFFFLFLVGRTYEAHNRILVQRSKLSSCKC